MVIYENIAYFMRYWFLGLFLIIVIGLIVVSVNEYREKKRIMAFAGLYLGFAEVIYSDDSDYEGARFGITVETSIGTAQKSDIIITGKNVLKKHAKIVQRDEKLLLVPFEGAVTQLNGKRINRARQLHTGDIILIGGTAMRIHLKAEKEADEE